MELTAAQKECVNFSEDNDLIVQGVAGSGKSLVIASRAVHLSQKAREAGARAKIIFFTFINTLVNYTREIINERGAAEDVEVSTLDNKILSLYDKLKGTQIDRQAVYLNMREKTSILNNVISGVNLDDASRSLQKLLSLEKREFLKDELSWMKQHRFTDVEEYQTCVRKGRGRTQIRRDDRPVIFQVYQTYYSELKRQGQATIDMICDEILSMQDRVTDEDKYDFVLIDEAQDLPLNKLLIAKLLARVSVTISADFAQKIYRTGFTWKEIGLDVRGRGSKRLRGTHRNTREIALLASSLEAHNTEKDDEDITPLEIPDRTGEKPVVIYAPSYAQEADDVTTLIRRIQDQSPSVTIGILVPTKTLIRTVAEWLYEEGIRYGIIDKKNSTSVLSPGVKLCTCHSAKGLEFDYVILPLVDEGNYPLSSSIDRDEEQEEDAMNAARNLLYVAMTRARTMLYILATNGRDGMPSLLLEELNPDYYQTSGEE